jgi:hypothetical protein
MEKSGLCSPEAQGQRWVLMRIAGGQAEQLSVFEDQEWNASSAEQRRASSTPRPTEAPAKVRRSEYRRMRCLATESPHGSVLAM